MVYSHDLKEKALVQDKKFCNYRYLPCIEVCETQTATIAAKRKKNTTTLYNANIMC